MGKGRGERGEPLVLLEGINTWALGVAAEPPEAEFRGGGARSVCVLRENGS
jgi:hypothetical protein